MALLIVVMTYTSVFGFIVVLVSCGKKKNKKEDTPSNLGHGPLTPLPGQSNSQYFLVPKTDQPTVSDSKKEEESRSNKKVKKRNSKRIKKNSMKVNSKRIKKKAGKSKSKDKFLSPVEAKDSHTKNKKEEKTKSSQRKGKHHKSKTREVDEIQLPRSRMYQTENLKLRQLAIGLQPSQPPFTTRSTRKEQRLSRKKKKRLLVDTS